MVSCSPKNKIVKDQLKAFMLLTLQQYKKEQLQPQMCVAVWWIPIVVVT